jgi:hypothetical protein
VNTTEGQKIMRDMAEKNGRDLDGTAIIATASEIDNGITRARVPGELPKPSNHRSTS